MGVREEGRGERGAPGCCVGGKQKLGSALVKEPEWCEIQGTAGPSAKQHQPWQEPWGRPASGAGVWPCLDARLGSSRLSQCQEAVALKEGRQDLAELLLWSSGSPSHGSGTGTGRSRGSVGPSPLHPQGRLLARVSVFLPLCTRCLEERK